jgi:hypothetical protein
MLTHANLLAAIIALRTFVSSYEVEMDDKDVFLSFLPLAHIFDRPVQLAAPLPASLRLPACTSVSASAWLSLRAWLPLPDRLHACTRCCMWPTQLLASMFLHVCTISLSLSFLSFPLFSWAPSQDGQPFSLASGSTSLGLWLQPTAAFNGSFGCSHPQ